MAERDHGAAHRRLTVTPDTPLRDAMQRMGEVGHGSLLVVDSREHLLGTLTDGDVRRGILASAGKLEDSIEKMYHREPVILATGEGIEVARERMLAHRVTVLPVVDPNGRLRDAVLWVDALGGKRPCRQALGDVHVVVMAGGVGSRMQPFTHVLPKPLLPIHEKPVLEVIMDNYHAFGAQRFHVVVNHRKEMLAAYFNEVELPYDLRFVDEGRLLGTCGGLSKVGADSLSEHFFLSNCDSILDADFADVHDFHCSERNDVTAICTLRELTIPYGVFELAPNGQIASIVEKPSYHHLTNTGVYLMKKTVLEHVEDDRSLGAPELIRRVLDAGGRASVFPLPADARLDTGQWDEYRHTLSTLESRGSSFFKLEQPPSSE